jgi:hypothetical protein
LIGLSSIYCNYFKVVINKKFINNPLIKVNMIPNEEFSSIFEKVPNIFNRVTFNRYMVGRDGYLLTHQVAFEFRQYKEETIYHLDHKPKVLEEWMESWLPLVPTHDYRSVPLCHPTEWKTIARYFHTRFRLLTIDASKVENLVRKFHPALEYGEYFGRVPLNAILSDEEYSWKPTDNGLDIPHSAEYFFKGELIYTKGYEPFKIKGIVE